MGRILVPTVGNWFDGLSRIQSYSEGVFEDKMLSHIEEIFPGYIVFPFKYDIQAKGLSTKRPDLAMLHQDYKEWWLLELEKSTHNLRHVKEQVEVFANAEYNPLDFKEKIKKKIEERGAFDLDEDKLLNLITQNVPKVLVIVDNYKKNWEDELKQYASICFLQVYRSTKAHEAFRLFGKYPIIFDEESHCILMNRIPIVIKISNSDFLESINDDQEVLITFNGISSSWIKFSKGKNVFIRFNGSINPLSAGKEYILKKDLNNNLHFKLN